MRAIVIARPGGPEVLEVRNVPTPEPGTGEARVRVVATAVNRADLLQRMGGYPAPADAPRDIPGLEFAGVVDACGPGVTGIAAGQRVFGLCGGGSYAEYVTVHARTLATIPEGLSFTDAAAIPEAFITAYDALVLQGGLAPGERVLVPAAASGVGTAALQIARAIGASPVATVRSAGKAERLGGLGAAHVVVVEGGRFADAVLRATGNAGVDVVLELVGGSYVPEDLACMSTRGRIVLVGLLGGARAEIDLGLVLRKRVTITGTVLRTRPLEEKIAVARAFERHVVPLVASGKLVPVVDRVLPLDEAARAHAYVASNEGFGKVVLTI